MYVSVLTLEKYLADLYGFAPGFQYHELSKERLEKKIAYYKHFLSVVSKVDPGLTKVIS